ncbi:MAG: hypothetical protein JXL80_10215, partial [Planctomycetes bacterium]|nr:hypothetical protein [Planctomycetota bacterium]
LVGLTIFTVVGLGWYAWAAATHPGLLDTFLGKEVVGRMFTNEFERNPEWYEPLIKYLPLMVLGPGLWIVFYRDLWRLVGPRLRRLWQTGRSNERVMFLLAWCVLPLVILSLSSSRMYLYVLPIFPPVVLALAHGLVRLQELRPRSARYWTIVAVLAVAIVLGGKAVMAYMPLAKDTRPFYELSRRLAPDDRRFVILCDQNEKYALMFYQKGRMLQVEPTGDTAVAQPRYDAIVREIRRRAVEGPVLVILRTYNEQLKKTIDAAGIGYTEHTGLRKRVVLLVDRATVAPAPTGR